MSNPRCSQLLLRECHRNFGLSDSQLFKFGSILLVSIRSKVSDFVVAQTFGSDEHCLYSLMGSTKQNSCWNFLIVSFTRIDFEKSDFVSQFAGASRACRGRWLHSLRPCPSYAYPSVAAYGDVRVAEFAEPVFAVQRSVAIG
jgi:hypothetical protein